MKRRLVALAASSALLLSACSSGPTPFEEAYEKYEGGAILMDEGAALELNGVGIEDPLGMDMISQSLYLIQLNVPDSVIVRMETTRALDGVQTAEWDGIHAQWTYHPDAGLDILLTEN